MTAAATLTSPRQRVNEFLATLDCEPSRRGALVDIESLCDFAIESGCDHTADVVLGEIIRIAGDVPSIHE